MHNHIVKISEEERRLYIYRVYDDGREELFTSVDLPIIKFDEDESAFRDFAKQLGENILIDSPSGRKIFEI